MSARKAVVTFIYGDYIFDFKNMVKTHINWTSINNLSIFQLDKKKHPFFSDWKIHQYRKSVPGPIPSQSRAGTLVPRYRESPGKHGTPKFSRPVERSSPELR